MGASGLDEVVKRLPAPLRAAAAERIAQFREQSPLSEHPLLIESLPLVWACSDYVALTCIRKPRLLDDLLAGDLERVYEDGTLDVHLRDLLDGVTDANELARRVRQFRHREMARIAWRDLAGWATLDETLRDLSAVAEACVDQALDYLYRWQCEAWGTPRDAQGAAQRLVVLAMGKLGGGELNFSSDIDLIFFYPQRGETDGTRPRSTDEFFTAVGRKLIHTLGAHTSDGQAFRVDMRLRPYGASGPLVMSFDAAESYYQSQGREWERYAMIKARVVGGDRVQGAALLKTLSPFVYRRYLDYGALESLRDLKRMIMWEVKRRGLGSNIKLGRGGIREVEFVGQAFQLIRGGRDRALRERRLLPVLRHAGAERLLPKEAADDLIDAYRFLRRAENRLQAIADRQTHELPETALDKLRLAYAMNFASWEHFLAALQAHRRTVQEQFDQVFMVQGAEQETSAGEELGVLWSADLPEDEAHALLSEAGFTDPAEALRRIVALRDGGSSRSLSTSGRRRLERLMPPLFAAVVETENPNDTLARLLDLLGAIVRRTAYLALLVEYPMALSQLVRLVSVSPWIARFLARHPLLLDELLDSRTLYAPVGGETLVHDLHLRLQGLENDLEQQMEVLRQFKQANYLRVAAADISGAVPLMVVSDYLTEIAEVTVAAVVDMAYRQIAARYGRPCCVDGGVRREAEFAVVAYGKLGGIELGYGSDLDVVFLHDSRGEAQITDGERPVDNQVFFARLAQRIVHIMNTMTPGGVLYEIDTRLRPSGNAGLLTLSLDAFADYQRNQAWTWEHQALVRARVVAGSESLRAGFDAVRREILGRQRDRDALREEVRDMRERMRRELGTNDPTTFDVKQDRGGIADIEFMVQYGVLAWARNHPGLLRYTDNIRLLEQLSETGWLTADESELLANAYRAYRSCVHTRTLQELPARVDSAALRDDRARVAALWQKMMED